METKEKTGSFSGISLVLAALTVLFAVSLVFLHKTAYEGNAHGDYTVTVQHRNDEITAPTRVLVNVNTADAAELETLTGIGPVACAGDHRLSRRARRLYRGGGAFACQGHRRGKARGLPRADHIHGGGTQ